MNDLNVTSEATAKHNLSPTPIDNIDIDRDLKNSSAISVLNIKHESDISAAVIECKTPVNDLVVTTESD